MNRPATDPAQLSRALEEWKMLATVFQGMLATPTGQRTCDAQQLVPVTILSGFLGSGKTTVLKRMLTGTHGLCISAIVNDFGAINLDAEDVEKVHDDVIELSNGCSCCQIGADFSKSLTQVATGETPPDHIVVEASGVSEPFSLGLLASMCPETSTAGIVTLVDAEALDAHPSLLRDDALFRRQIEVAHLLVLTKTDRLPGERIPGLMKALESVAPGRMVVDSSSDDLNQLILEGASKLGARPEPGKVHHDVHQFETKAVVVSNVVSKGELEERLEGIPAGLLRLKGRLPAVGGGALDVQCVDSRWNIHVEEDEINEGYLVAIGHRDGDGNWQQWTSDLFGWLQGEPDTAFYSGSALNRQND
jgi:G3E family GTPase